MAEPLAMSTVPEMSEKAPFWDEMVARMAGPACRALRPDCKLAVRALDAQLP
jgi:hypothetical protein